jgi:murein endopeptidase
MRARALAAAVGAVFLIVGAFLIRQALQAPEPAALATVSSLRIAPTEASVPRSARARPRKAPFPVRRAVASRSFGLPWRGALAGGVQLPAEGPGFFTWDPVRRRSPNRGWRRFGTERLVRTVLTVVEQFRAAHPDAPRIGIGDLSRPRGGDLGPRYGLPGHVSHQNGLDVDIYYPRRDGLERAPESAQQIDRALAQELVERFVRAGASRVFVGPLTGLSGDPAVVQVLPRHDNHLHVRLP